jgi:hypothetical protein
MTFRWRDIGCCAALAWLSACHAVPEAPRGGANKKPAVRPAAAAPAARPTPDRPATSVRAPAATQRAAPPRPGRVLTSSVREVSLEPGALDAALGAMPETRDLAATFRPFGEQALSRAWTAQRAQQGIAGVQAARTALLWTPPRGEQVLVLSGDTPQGAVLLAFTPRPSGGPRFAASYRTRGEHAPILLGARAGAAEELLFSTCWACGGEGGALRLDPAGRPRLVLR